MKFTDIGKRAKAGKTAIILSDAHREQWIYTGGGFYKLDGLPKMTAEDFLRLLGISEKEMEKYETEVNGLQMPPPEADSMDSMLDCDMAGISIDYMGIYLMPFYTIFGVIWVSVNNMEPFIRGDTRYLRFFLRRIGAGFFIIVKDGLRTIAMIPEYQMPEALLHGVRLLAQQCEIRGIPQAEREEESSMKYKVCERCGAHLDFGETCDCKETEN